MSHHLTVITNNGFLTTLPGVPVGSAQLRLRECSVTTCRPLGSRQDIRSWVLYIDVLLFSLLVLMEAFLPSSQSCLFFIPVTHFLKLTPKHFSYTWLLFLVYSISMSWTYLLTRPAKRHNPAAVLRVATAPLVCKLLIL